MRLQAAARYFDKTPCVDAYTGAPCFLAQLNLYDDTKRDSETGERRILSVGSGAVMPTRRVVRAADRNWIIGHGNPDTFQGGVLRVGYVVHEATELSRVRTIGQICRDELGFTAWSGRAWIKNLADNENSSRLSPQYHFHFGSNEVVAEESFLTSMGRLHIVRTSHVGPAGTLIALSDEMPEPVVEFATVTTGTYDPITETRTAGTTVARAVRARWQSAFKYRQQTAPKFGPGDIQLAFAKSVITAQAGMKATLSDGVWMIQSALSEGDVWLCQARRHV